MSDTGVYLPQRDNEMKFDDIPFATGDLLLFHGKTKGGNCLMDMLSGLIEGCTHSKFSHSGIVIKDPKFTPQPLEGLYLLESTGLEDVKDVENKEIKFGVQLRNLREVIQNYDGVVYWRQIICERDQTFYKKLAQAHSVVHNRPYDDGFDYIKAAFDWHIGNVQKKKTFFCSALCAYVYVCLEFLPATTPWSIITPSDLSTEPKRSIELDWSNCQIKNEVKVLPY